MCPVCAEKFKQRLKAKYGTVDALNKAWNLTIFSQEYNFFDEIPTPRDAWVNPHHRLEWKIFQQESIVEFVTMQAEILKKYVKVPVGTDVMPVNGMNYLHLNKKLDIVQFNHYNNPDNLSHCSMWFDFLRNVKDRPFWNTETSTCWNGSANIPQSVKPEGFCYANSWLPIALGGEANMYWLWRTHWGGHEIMHGSVLDACGRPMHIYNEVKKIAKDYVRAGYFLNRTKVTTPIAVHYPSLSWNFFETQGIVQGFRYQDSVIQNVYEPIVQRGLRPDLLEAAQDFSQYKVLFTPFVPSLENEGLGERIRQWVENGGVWVVGPMTDNRNIDGARYKDRPFGMLEEFLGVRWAYAVPDLNGEIKCQWASGQPFTSRLWYELYEKAADALATVAEAPHSALVGKAVAFKKKIGKGVVFLLGTIPSADVMRGNILPLALDAAGLSTGHVGDSRNLMVARREGHGMTGVVVVEYQGKPGRYTLDKPAVELITAHKLEGTIDVKPYQVLVLQE
jgi:beta-galactosidase GanA